MLVHPLSSLALSLAAMLVMLLGFLSWRMKLNLEKQLAIGTVRTVLQLLLVGYILKIVFADSGFILVFIMSGVMLVVAGREIVKRQERRIKGFYGWWLGICSMFISSFTVAFFALAVIIGNDPWYAPRYAIPLLGMLLGNSMNGISVALERLTSSVWQQRQVIEQRLMLGHSSTEAVADIKNQAIRSGMIPQINSMMVVGLVSLPGMMTGQILGGTSPMEAVKYQILIMMLICSGTGFGCMVAISMAVRKLFDARERLCLDILENK